MNDDFWKFERLKIDFLQGIEKANGGVEGMNQMLARIQQHPPIYQAFLKFFEVQLLLVMYGGIPLDDGIALMTKLINAVFSEEGLAVIQHALDKIPPDCANFPEEQQKVWKEKLGEALRSLGVPGSMTLKVTLPEDVAERIAKLGGFRVKRVREDQKSWFTPTNSNTIH